MPILIVPTGLASRRESPAATQRVKEALCLIVFFNPLSHIPQQLVKCGNTSFHASENLYLRKNCSGRKQGYLFSCLHGENTDRRSCRTRDLAPVAQHCQHLGPFPPPVNSLLSLFEFVAMSLLQHREDISLKDSAFSEEKFRVER